MMISILMTLATIIVCAIGLGCVIVWRLKPQESPEVEGLRQHVATEEQKVRTLQEKLEEAQSRFNAHVADVATAQAQVGSAERRADEASANLKHKENELSRLQQMYNGVSPQLERANAERASAVRVKTEAWLLAEPNLFAPKVRDSLQKLSRKPEDVNTDTPPAKMLNALYQKHLGRGYQKVTDGSNPFPQCRPLCRCRCLPVS